MLLEPITPEKITRYVPRDGDLCLPTISSVPVIGSRVDCERDIRETGSLTSPMNEWSAYKQPWGKLGGTRRIQRSSLWTPVGPLVISLPALDHSRSLNPDRGVSRATEHLKLEGRRAVRVLRVRHRPLIISFAGDPPSSLRDGGARTVECDFVSLLQRSPVTTPEMALGEQNRLPYCVAAFLRSTARGGISEIALPESGIS